MESVIETKAQNKTRLLHRKKASHEKQQLLNDILTARREMDTVIKNIDFVDDDMLLEHYIFKLKACELRYRYLITKAKENGISYQEYAEKLICERYCR